MFVISRCQTLLNPRLGWEGRTPVNKAKKRPPGPLERHSGCGPSQLSGSCFVTPFLKWLHIAKCAIPGKVLESDVLAAFSVSSWVAMGKWTVFRQSDQALGRAPCGFHSPPVLENLSLAAWLCGFLRSPSPPSYFIYKCHTTHPGPGSVVVTVYQQHQAVVASDGPWLLGVCLRAPFMPAATQIYSEVCSRSKISATAGTT